MNMVRMRFQFVLAIYFTISIAASVNAQANSHQKSNPIFPPTTAAQWKILSHRPVDTSDIDNVRIWFSPSNQGSCRFKIWIADSSMAMTRHVIDKMLSHGYYNLYWDKRDDSGRLVPPGKYRYFVRSECGHDTQGKLIVTYKKWERALHFSVDSSSDTAAVFLQVDSARTKVSLRVTTLDSTQVGTLCRDSVFRIGTHRLVWMPKEQLARGEYIVWLNAGDYVTERRVKLK